MGLVGLDKELGKKLDLDFGVDFILTLERWSQMLLDNTTATLFELDP